MQHVLAIVGETQVAELNLAFDGEIARLGRVLNLRLLDQDFVEPQQRRRAALENVNHPAQRDDRPRQLHHVESERGEVADVDVAQQHFAPANPQHQHHGNAQHELERRPQHAHQPYQLQASPDVFVVGRLKRCDLRIFLRVSANHPDAGEILLGTRGNVREHGLNSFEPLMNATSEILDHHAGHRQWQEGVKRQLGTDGHHEAQGGRGEHHRVRRIHDGRAQQHAHRIQIIGRPGHNVASPHLLVIGIRESFKMREEVVA